MDLFAFAVNIIRKGYKPHMSPIFTIILGIFTFLIVFLVLYVRFKFMKELKRRGLKESDIRKRKKTNRR